MMLNTDTFHIELDNNVCLVCGSDAVTYSPSDYYGPRANAVPPCPEAYVVQHCGDCDNRQLIAGDPFGTEVQLHSGRPDGDDSDGPEIDFAFADVARWYGECLFLPLTNAISATQDYRDGKVSRDAVVLAVLFSLVFSGVFWIVTYIAVGVGLELLGVDVPGVGWNG